MKQTDAKTETKTFAGVAVKDADKGEVQAVIATLDVVDRDGDIIRPSAIPTGSKVAMSSYGHDAFYGNPPVGKGTLSVEGKKLLFDGRTFLNTTGGRDTFETLKEMGADQEWSFGFRVLGYEVPSEEERKQGAVRILTKLDAFEVSPVLIGAGIGTRTLGVKSEEKPIVEEPEPPKPTEEETVQRLAEIKAAEKLAEEARAQLLTAGAKEYETFQRTLKRLGVVARG